MTDPLLEKLHLSKIIPSRIPARFFSITVFILEAQIIAKKMSSTTEKASLMEG